MVGSRLHGEEKSLVFILVTLIVIIAILIVAVLLFWNKSNSENDALGAISDNILASEVSNNIETRFNSELGYSVNDAKNDYEAEMLAGDDSYRVYVAIYYANFAYSVNKDIKEAVAILDRVEPLINDYVAVDYYVTLERLYEWAGMDEEVEFYRQKVSELIPRDSRSAEELMGGIEAGE